MAHTILPADRLKLACEKTASQLVAGTDDRRAVILSILHLASAALSVNPNASLTVTADEFFILAEHW